MYQSEQLVSLLYYMGMLTFLPQPEGTTLPRLTIPNRMIRDLLRQWPPPAPGPAKKCGEEVGEERTSATGRLRSAPRSSLTQARPA
jgi:hypothetical protein